MPSYLSRSQPSVDLSRDIVDTTVARMPTASALGEWEYSRALFLMGELSVFNRTHDPSYLAYAKAWVDMHVDAHGNIDHPINALDFIMPGNVLLDIYSETGDERYRQAASSIYAVYASYPRTSDGAFWHAETANRQHQLWLDGTFMALPFLVRYGALSGHAAEANHEAARQLIVYAKHLHDAHGPLFYHAYDESGKAPWADAKTHQSSVKWARGIGWYALAIVIVLDAMPALPATPEAKRDKQQLLSIVHNLAHDLRLFQDPSTGLWFQIIDQPALKGNFLETSSSCMFTYFLDRAVKRGYLGASYRMAAQRGYAGVRSVVVLGGDGHYHVTGICEGTNVGDTLSYLTRKRKTDDFHGLGAFLLMNEEVQSNQPAMLLAKIGH